MSKPNSKRSERSSDQELKQLAKMEKYLKTLPIAAVILFLLIFVLAILEQQLGMSMLGGSEMILFWLFIASFVCIILYKVSIGLVHSRMDKISENYTPQELSEAMGQKEKNFVPDDNVEKKLNQLLRLNRVRLIVLYLGILLIIVSCVMALFGSHDTVVIITVLVGFGLAALGGFSMNAVRKRIKQISAYYTPKALAESMDRLDSYDPTGSVDHSYLWQNFGRPSFSRVGPCSDHVKGVIRGIPVEFSEFELQDERASTDNDGNTQIEYVPVCNGVMLICQHRYELQGNFFVSQLVAGDGKLKTESERFNRYFSIGADEEHEVFYVLTPRYMEKLIEASDDLSGTRVALRFCNDGTLLVVLSGVDLFEADNRGGHMFETGEQATIEGISEKIKKQISLLGDILTMLEVSTQEDLKN